MFRVPDRVHPLNWNFVKPGSGARRATETNNTLNVLRDVLGATNPLHTNRERFANWIAVRFAALSDRIFVKRPRWLESL
jgi:hypothetical protein